MTRINSDIDPATLTDQHLMAEYRELTMVPASLRRSLRTKTKAQVLKRVPPAFTLNKGHVTFWYNKLAFLKQRYAKLQTELTTRGFNIDPTRSHNCDGFDVEFYGSYTMTATDAAVITARIDEKIALKPHWYKRNKQPINT